MAQSSKKQVSAKMNKAVEALLTNGLNKAEKHYKTVLDNWAQTTPEQRRAFLEHSPILSRLIAFAKRWEV